MSTRAATIAAALCLTVAAWACKGGDAGGDSAQPQPFPLTEGEAGPALAALEAASEHEMRGVALAVLSEVGDRLYGGGIGAVAGQAAGVAEEMRSIVVMKGMMSRLTAIPGCGQAFQAAAAAMPEMQGPLIHKGCAEGLDWGPPNQSHRHTPWAVALAAVLDQHATKAGWASEKLHRALIYAVRGPD